MTEAAQTRPVQPRTVARNSLYDSLYDVPLPWAALRFSCLLLRCSEVSLMPARSATTAARTAVARALPLPFKSRRRKATGGEEDRNPWRCLRYPSMRWWSLANLVSNMGTWMQLTVQNVLVLQVTGSPALTGLSLAVQAGPGLLLGLLGGAAVDAWPRKITAAVSQSVLGLVAFTTATLVAFDLVNVATLLTLAAVTGTVATVDAPACALLGNDLVPRRDVPSAIALGSTVHSAGRLAGTALAGVAVGLLGSAAAFAVNGLSFLFVACVIPFLRLVRPERDEAADEPATAPGGRPARRAGASPRDGLAFFLRRPRLVALAALTGLSSIFGRNYGLTLAVLVTGPLGAGAASFGAVSTALAIGGMVGAVLAGTLRRPSVRVVAAMAATGAVLQMVAGLSPTLALLVVLVVPMALVESISDTAGATVLQTDPPAHMRGRVLGVWRSMSTAWGLVGPPLIGLMMELLGARASLVVGGAVIAGAAGVGTLLHRRRQSAAARPAALTAAPDLALVTAPSTAPTTAGHRQRKLSPSGSRRRSSSSGVVGARLAGSAAPASRRPSPSRSSSVLVSTNASGTRARHHP